MADPDRILLQPDVYADWHEPFPEIPDEVRVVRKTGGVWGDRPTTDPDVLVLWIGADPSPPGAVAPAVNGMYPGDLRITELSAGEDAQLVTSVDNRIGAVNLTDRYVALVSGRAAAAQLPTDYTTFGRDRGSGTSLPGTDRRRGDTYFHTGLGCLMVWDGAAWRQAAPTVVSSDAAKTAISTAYSALLHEAFRVWVSDTDRIWDWTGTFWRIVTPDLSLSAYATVDRPVALSWQQVICDALVFDNLGGYSASTGVWTVPFTGRYRLNGAAAYAANTSGVRGAYFQVRANAGAAWVPIPGSASIVPPASIQTVVSTPATRASLTAGQQVALFGYQNAVNPLNQMGSIEGQQCAFGVDLIAQTA